MLRRVLPRLYRLRADSRPVLPTVAALRTRPPALRAPLARRLHSAAPPPPRDNAPLPPHATVSQRLKHLVRSYGWYALGVYLVFSALDFTVAFVGIKLLGAEQVSQAAAYVKQAVFGLFHTTPPEPGRDQVESTAAASGGQEGLYAMLVLAYTIHKTLFLPLRVGLTAAFTPRIVGWLRARGWAGARRAGRELEGRDQH